MGENRSVIDCEEGDAGLCNLYLFHQKLCGFFLLW